MVWPFGSRVSTKEPHDEPVPRHAVSWSELLSRAGNDPSGAAKEWAPMIFCSLAGLGALQLYANYLRRIPGAAFIRPSSFRSRSLFGRVTSVGDGDGFHLFHTPGGKTVGWGWLRKIPETRKDLKDRTVNFLWLRHTPLGKRQTDLFFLEQNADFDPSCWCRCPRRSTFRPSRATICSRSSDMADPIYSAPKCAGLYLQTRPV